MSLHKTNDGFVRFVAIVICIVWALWILLTCIIVIGNIFYDELAFLDKYILTIIYSVAIFSVFSIFLLIQPECKLCGKKVFNEPLKSQKNANYWAFVNGWSSVVVQIVTKKQFICMHCGKTITLKTKDQGKRPKKDRGQHGRLG